MLSVCMYFWLFRQFVPCIPDRSMSCLILVHNVQLLWRRHSNKCIALCVFDCTYKLQFLLYLTKYIQNHHTPAKRGGIHSQGLNSWNTRTKRYHVRSFQPAEYEMCSLPEIIHFCYNAEFFKLETWLSKPNNVLPAFTMFEKNCLSKSNLLLL